MKLDLPIIRTVLYFILGIFSVVLFCLCAARLHYTTHLPADDPLNGGDDFYDPIIVELLFGSILTIPWCIFIIYAIHKRTESKRIFSSLGEFLALSLLWLFWLFGAAIATGMWGDLSFCRQYRPCRFLTALVAFAWIGCIVITAILAVFFIGRPFTLTRQQSRLRVVTRDV